MEDQTPKKINVIEYKGKLFKTQEEYNEFRREELVSQLSFISGHAVNAINFLEVLSANAINTKAKLDQLILDVKKYSDEDAENDEEQNVKVPGVNCNEEPDEVEGIVAAQVSGSSFEDEDVTAKEEDTY